MTDREPQSRSGGPPPNASDPFLGSNGAEEQRLYDALGLHGSEASCVAFCPICRTADVLRAGAPPELREQWHSVQREALLTMKAAIEFYLERLSEPGARGPTVEDIPIE